ncbi:MAG: hypothetical protein K1060chlam5_00494 [Candidatus Anoxychlamydiales bacterium]|nr:hypothetical protein [Candidatus Anoxychlamydiales bacterium]
MQSIQKIFFLDDKMENKALFYVFLGPLFLLLSASLAKIDLIIISFIALFLIYRFLKVGLIISSVILAVYITKNHLYTTNHMYDFGIEMSVFLGFIISTFSFDEAKEMLVKGNENLIDEIEKLKNSSFEHIDKFDEHKRSNLENLSKLKYEYELKLEELSSLKNEKENLLQKIEEEKEAKDIIEYEKSIKDKKLKEKDLEIEALYDKLNDTSKNEKTINLPNNIEGQAGKIENLNKTIEDLTNEKELLNQKIISLNDSAEVENENDSIAIKDENKKLNEEIENLKLKIEKNENKSILNLDYSKDEIEKLKKANHLYLQLKDQFDEKATLLSQTRKDLFEAKEKLNAFQKEDIKDFSDLNDEEKKLINDLNLASNEVEIIKIENDILNSLILDLLQKKDDKKTTEFEGDQLGLPFS